MADLASALGLDEPTALDLILEALRGQTLSRADQRAAEQAHLLGLRAALEPMALDGDLGAARVLVGLHSALATLLSLPEKPSPEIAAEDELERIRRDRAGRHATG